MQKGNDTARSMHIALNSINLLLFVTQIPTGLEIVGKVRRGVGRVVAGGLVWGLGAHAPRTFWPGCRLRCSNGQTCLP